ncbi:MAG: hypothetical protein QXE64_00370 [Candidatus Pacearchaeota archaeon]
MLSSCVKERKGFYLKEALDYLVLATFAIGAFFTVFYPSIKKYNRFLHFYRSSQRLEYRLKAGDNITKLCRSELLETEFNDYITICRDLVIEENDIKNSRKMHIGQVIYMRDLNRDGKIGNKE